MAFGFGPRILAAGPASLPTLLLSRPLCAPIPKIWDGQAPKPSQHCGETAAMIEQRSSERCLLSSCGRLLSLSDEHPAARRERPAMRGTCACDSKRLWSGAAWFSAAVEVRLKPARGAPARSSLPRPRMFGRRSSAQPEPCPRCTLNGVGPAPPFPVAGRLGIKVSYTREQAHSSECAGWDVVASECAR